MEPKKNNACRGNHLLVIFALGTGFSFLLLVAVFAFIRLPVPPIPLMAMGLNETTTNAAGTRLHILGITNHSPTTVFAYMPQALIKNDPIPVAKAPWSVTLPPGAASILALPAPTNAVRWKLSLYVYNDFDLPRRIERFLFRRRFHPYFMESSWFEADATNATAQIRLRGQN